MLHDKNLGSCDDAAMHTEIKMTLMLIGNGHLQHVLMPAAEACAFVCSAQLLSVFVSTAKCPSNDLLLRELGVSVSTKTD